MSYLLTLLRSFLSAAVPHNTFPTDNTGVLSGQRDTDYIGGTLPFEVRNPSGDWRTWLPNPDEIQYSQSADSMACVSFSLSNSLEIQARKLTGQSYNWSDRFLAKMSGTTQQGNYLYKVADAVRTFGLVNEATWPVPGNFDWNSFYSSIPQTVIEKGKREFPFSIAYEFITPDKATLLHHLQHAPIQITIPGAAPQHAVCLVAIVGDVYYYYDSYGPFLKSMSTPPAALKVTLYSNDIAARLVGWINGPEEGLYFPFDTPQRKQAVIDAVTTAFPGYRVDPIKVVIPVKKPF
jgi:hypothetical protein